MFSAAKLPKKAKSRLSAANFFPRDQRRPGRQRCGAGRQWLWRGRLQRPGFGGSVFAARFWRPGFGTTQVPAAMRGSGGAGFGDSGFGGPILRRCRFRRRCGVPAAQALPGLNLRVQSYAGPARCRCRSRFRKLSRTKTKHPGNLPGCLCPCCRRLFRAAGAACSVVPYLAARMLFSA